MKISYVVTLVIGAAIGSVTTYVLLKDKYDTIIQEELASIREYQLSKLNKHSPNESSETESTDDKIHLGGVPEEQNSYMEYYKKISEDSGYTNYSGTTEQVVEKKGKKEQKKAKSKPVVISPDEFGEDEDYETLSVQYYADGFVSDSDGNLVTDVEEKLGLNIESHFGEFEDDCVYIRNDELHAYYEVLKDYGKYIDVRKNKAYEPMEE